MQSASWWFRGRCGAAARAGMAAFADTTRRRGAAGEGVRARQASVAFVWRALGVGAHG